jgi:predicted NUDIX family NTP pyrophosphohydrolase
MSFLIALLTGMIWGTDVSGCTALLAHPKGDFVASKIDGVWIGDDGFEVKTDHLTHIMVPKGDC